MRTSVSPQQGPTSMGDHQCHPNRAEHQRGINVTLQRWQHPNRTTVNSHPNGGLTSMRTSTSPQQGPTSMGGPPMSPLRGSTSPQWRPNANEDLNITPTGPNVNGGPPMSPSRGSMSPQQEPTIMRTSVSPQQGPTSMGDQQCHPKRAQRQWGTTNVTPMEAQRQ